MLLAALVGAGSLTGHAQTSALLGLYTQVAVGDPDFGGGANAQNVSIMPDGMVQTQLGPDGLPVLSAAGVAALGTSSDMNPATQELLWWSPGANPYVSHDAIPVSVDSLPFSYGYPNLNWYVTGQTGDQNFYRTVHWQGNFNLASAGPVSLSLSVDDDVWVFIDGTLALEDHYGTVANGSPTFSAGEHSVDVFYDDRFPVYNALNFSSSVSMTPAPEPGAMTLLAAGALCLVACGWRRTRPFLSF